MGLFTLNINNHCVITNHAQTEPARRPPENNGSKGTWIDLLLGVAVSYYADPYLNGIKAMLAQVFEAVSVSSDYAATVSALVCFTVVCAAPMIIRKVFRKLLK